MMLAMSGRLPIKHLMVFLLQLLSMEIPIQTAPCPTYLDKDFLGVPAKVNLIPGQFIQMVHMWVALLLKSMSSKHK